MNRDALLEKANKQLLAFMGDCNIPTIYGKEILEIGFKNALFAKECHKLGAKITSTEINSEYFNQSRKLFPELDLLLVDPKEEVPFPEGSFDYIVSFQVLEHVEDLDFIIDECIRLLKPGGIMYHVCPNYNSFYEGHFNVIWTPFFNKSLGRIYLKILGKYHEAYENLNLTTPRKLKKIVSGKNITIISFGESEFGNYFDTVETKKIKNIFVRNVVNQVVQRKLLKSILLIPLKLFNFYYPIKLIVIKNKNE